MNNFLKIPSKCYVQSKERGMLNDVVFYYQLKMIDSHGFFMNGTLNSLHNKLSYSQSSIWKKINRLLSNKLIKRNNNGYQLISYDNLFIQLGYDLSYNNDRKGSFKIHRIPFSDCHHLKDLIAFIDIRDNLNQQTYRAFNNLKQSNQYTAQNLYCTNINDKRHILSSLVKQNTVQMITSNDKNEELTKVLDAFDLTQNSKHCNPDITLSLKGVCRILGLNNTSSAHVIMKRLSDQNRVQIVNRQIFIETTTLSYNEFKQKFGDRYILKNQMVFRTLSNLITCIKN